VPSARAGAAAAPGRDPNRPAAPAAVREDPRQQELGREAVPGAARTADSWLFLEVVQGIQRLSSTDFFIVSASASAFWAKSTRVRKSSAVTTLSLRRYASTYPWTFTCAPVLSLAVEV